MSVGMLTAKQTTAGLQAFPHHRKRQVVGAHVREHNAEIANAGDRGKVIVAHVRRLLSRSSCISSSAAA